MVRADKNTLLNIDLRAVKDNYKKIKKKVGRLCNVAATVKANAYGLGVRKIATILIKNGCNNFFVATTDEAIELRKINKNICIFILNGLIANKLEVINKYKLTPVINNLDQLKRVERYQSQKKNRLNIALHFDTGMSRLGFDKSETNHLLIHKNKLIKNSEISLVMSHLACADNPKKKKNHQQLREFIKISKFFPNIPLSLSNSAGLLLGKQFHFDMVRPGISLYGGHCQNREKKIYKNVVSLKAKLIQIRNIKKGDTIGYGATFVAKKNMRVGTLAFGYADGFNRMFSNNYHVLFKGKKIKLVGRVSMDLITVDLSNIKDEKNIYNADFEILGENYSINDTAKLIKTIPYEILTNLGKRYERRYIS